MKKMILKTVIFLLIYMLLIVIGGYLCTNYDGQYIYRMMNEMYDCKENIDVVFLGSSHTYRSYDTALADTLLGVKTFNAGSSSQGMNTSYYLLKEICEYHDVKEVYLDTYYGISKMEKNDASVFIISDYMKAGANKTKLLWDSGRIDMLLNGYLIFRRNNTNYNIISNMRSRKSEISDYSSISYWNEEYRGDGFVYSFEVIDVEKADFGSCSKFDFSSGKPINDDYYFYLTEIVEFCKKNNIELILVDQPMLKQNTDSVIEYDNYVQFFADFAEKNNLEYWNFNLYKESLELKIEDYKDTDHLNGKGAEKFTNCICNLILDREKKNVKAADLFWESY